MNLAISVDATYRLELLSWETHTDPELGRPQERINEQIGNYDIFIGIMWKRFGSPTGLAQSGTEEEFKQAHRLWLQTGKPKVLFYFCTAPFTQRTEEEKQQHKQVIAFKNQLEKKGLIAFYSNRREFGTLVRRNLERTLRREFSLVTPGQLDEDEDIPGEQEGKLLRVKRITNWLGVPKAYYFYLRGHQIEVEIKASGSEKVSYDGEEVTSKFSILGGTYAFFAQESGQEVQYVIEIGPMVMLKPPFARPYLILRRNGLVLYTDRY